MREKIQRVKAAYLTANPFTIGVWIYTVIIGGLIAGIMVGDYLAARHLGLIGK